MLVNVPKTLILLLYTTAATVSASTFVATHNDLVSGTNVLETRQGCPAENVECPSTGCNGINDPDNGVGLCTTGEFAGCPCKNICGAKNGKCNENNCGGLHDPLGGPGICTLGVVAGCACDSDCGTEPGPCNANGCKGVNEPGGAFGYCTAGNFAGCLCLSVCEDHDGACDSNGCNGVNGVCTGEGLVGCPCGHECGNLEAKSCSDNGCAGVNVPGKGFGVCTQAFKGCVCQTTCGPTPGPCGGNGCKGEGGFCKAGDFNGCSCV